MLHAIMWSMFSVHGKSRFLVTNVKIYQCTYSSCCEIFQVHSAQFLSYSSCCEIFQWHSAHCTVPLYSFLLWNVYSLHSSQFLSQSLPAVKYVYCTQYTRLYSTCLCSRYMFCSILCLYRFLLCKKVSVPVVTKFNTFRLFLSVPAVKNLQFTDSFFLCFLYGIYNFSCFSLFLL